jgi:hypothetical protein
MAVDKGLRKLRRATYHARAAKAASAPVSRELMRIARSIAQNGLDVQMADLERMVGAAVAIEAEPANRWRASCRKPSLISTGCWCGRSRR